MKKLYLHILIISFFLTFTVHARNTLLTYISTDEGSTWKQSFTEIKNLSTKSAVDPAPILTKNKNILLYYLGSNNTSGDPAKKQPDKIWRMIVANSSDGGKTFKEVAISYMQKKGMTDPFPVILPSGEFKLYISKGASVFSASSKDGINFKKDKGFRSSEGKGGVPGALVLKDGTVNLYVCKGKDILYFFSKDGMKFKKGGIALKAPKGSSLCDPSPVKNPNGGYSMAYKIRKPANSKNPKDDAIMIADSIDGKKWISRKSLVGKGSVPGLVINSKGDWYIYATGFAGKMKESKNKNQSNKRKKWMMFKNPPKKIKKCFLKFLSSKEINVLADVGKPEDEKLFKKGRKALKNCTKQIN